LLTRIDAQGQLSTNDALGQWAVDAGPLDEVTNHRIAQPFWEFITASGLVYQNGAYVSAPLFENPYFATGRPITEAYWATVRVGGVAKDVLIQCFERRCLTYTPDNAPEWRVEAGNVGRHYYAWRYTDAGEQPVPGPSEPLPPTAVNWRQVTPEGLSPAARSYHSLTVDTGGNQVYLFGGRDGGVYYIDLWVLDLASESWTQLQPAGGPPAGRFGHNAAFDPVANRLIIYGGEGEAFYGDTWAYDIASNTWSQLSIGGPLNRYGAGGAYNPASGLFYVTHGFTSSGRFDDTWAFTPGSAEWLNVTPANGSLPEARCLTRAVLDPAGGRLLLFGGQSNSNGFLGDLWAFDLETQTWNQLDLSGPSGRNLYAWAAREGDALLFGGNAGGVNQNDLWRFDYAGNVWQPLDQSDARPSPRNSHDLVWAATQQLVLFGGDAGGALDDLWIGTFVS
jgi:hypothetical protein